jgi:hypothetical protein
MSRKLLQLKHDSCHALFHTARGVLKQHIRCRRILATFLFLDAFSILDSICQVQCVFMKHIVVHL